MIADGFDWHFERTGSSDGPPLLLLHGFTGCLEFWSDIATALAPAFDTVVVDLPGHGNTRSLSDSQLPSMEVVSRALVACLSNIGVSRCHVWGYSMGGRLGLYLAVHVPQAVERLVLESASPGIEDVVERDNRRKRDSALAERIARIGIEGFVTEWMDQPLFASQKRFPKDKQHRAHTLRCQNSIAGLTASLLGMGTGIQQPLHDKLSSLASPALILTGELDSKFCAIGQMMAARMPNARHHVIPDAGHAPHWERRDACVALVQAFLNEQPVPKIP